MDEEPYKYAYLRGDPNDGFTKIDPDIREKFEKLPADKQKKQKAKSFILFEFELREQQAKPFEEKLRDSIDFSKEHLKAFDRPYVATSFGMHSIVLMKIVMVAVDELKKEGYDIEYPDMFLNHTLNTFKEEQEYWVKMTDYWGIKNKVQLFYPPKDKKTGKQQTVWSIADKYGHLPSFRTLGGKKKTGSGGKTPECCNILKKKAMKAYLNGIPEDGRYNLQFIGTLAEESHARTNNVLQKCRTFLLKTFVKYPMRKCEPLGFWTDKDVKAFYKFYNLPVNPTYEAHNVWRTGCASCPAHQYWASRLACDPTEEGFGMLKQNFKILKKTEAAGTEREGRLQESIDELKQLLKTRYSKYHKKQQVFTPTMVIRLERIIEEFDQVS